MLFRKLDGSIDSTFVMILKKEKNVSNVQLSEMNCSWLNWIDGTRTQNNPIQPRVEKMWLWAISKVCKIIMRLMNWVDWREGFPEYDANSDHTNSSSSSKQRNVEAGCIDDENGRYGGADEKRNGGLIEGKNCRFFTSIKSFTLKGESDSESSRKKRRRCICDWAKALAMNSSNSSC